MRIIAGEAGSGKTFVAAKLLLDDIKEGNRVLLCTEDPILFEHMYHIVESNGVDPIALEWKRVDSSNTREHLVSIIDVINDGKYGDFSRIHFDEIHLEKRVDLLDILKDLKDPEKVSVSMQTVYTGCKSVKVYSYNKNRNPLSGSLEKVVPREDLEKEFSKLGAFMETKRNMENHYKKDTDITFKLSSQLGVEGWSDPNMRRDQKN
ncbi:putative P-loop containing nucleoside triphosphate hydrolase [Bacillus phage vB_BsuM-Goe10]|nr:putative P-loop containing nucleoside triphosphate hydrolase [Bacillus phage vB_BsuM-Goe10]